MRYDNNHVKICPDCFIEHRSGFFDRCSPCHVEWVAEMNKRHKKKAKVLSPADIDSISHIEELWERHGPRPPQEAQEMIRRGELDYRENEVRF